VTTLDAIERLFTEGALDPAWFSATFLAAVPMEKATSILSDLVGALGAYQAIAPNGTSFALTFARGSVQAEAALDENGAFATLTFNRMQSKMAEERLTAILQTSHVPTAWFNDLFLAAVPIDNIIAMLEGIKAQSGAFRNIFPTGDGTYDVTLAKGRYSARIYLGRDGKILGLIFNPR
jgi:hypothetical protein